MFCITNYKFLILLLLDVSQSVLLNIFSKCTYLKLTSPEKIKKDMYSFYKFLCSQINFNISSNS